MKQSGPREFYWGTLLPMSVLAALGTSVLVAVLAAWMEDLTLGEVARLAGIALTVQLLLLLPILFYVVRTRVERPMLQLGMELQGERPWQPESDVLFSTLRHAAENVRESAQESRTRAESDEQAIAELRERLREREAGDALVVNVAQALQSAEPVQQFALQAARLLREAWPAQAVLVLELLDSEADLRVLLYEPDEDLIVSGGAPEEPPRLRKASLPTPVKEALRRGSYSEVGLPFSQDSTFPRARSFVALGLEHRGATVGVLYAITSQLAPPPASSLLRARSLFSMAFSRSLYRMEMEDAAIRDALSSAYTQDHFLSETRRELARSNRYSRPVSCVAFDIDSLRRVNDQLSPRAGDQLIGDLARVVDGTIRSSDTLTRITGGEFAVLLPEADDTAATAAAERIRSAVEAHPFILERNRVERITVSAGIATHPPHGITALELLDAARAAMIQAKGAGRNRIEVAPE